MRWTLLAVLALVSGCDAIDLEQLVKQHPPLTRVDAEPVGANCAQGGKVVRTGLDLNDNGELDAHEEVTTEYACVTTLARQRPEPAGAHCAQGGQAVRTGPDLNDNGELDDSEVTGTEYVCATPIPNVLLRTRQVPPGEKCPHGGQVSHAGRDADGDGILGDTEITREVYGCNEPEAVLTRVRALISPPFVCQSNSAIVEAGLDVDRDGVFDDAELRAATRICVDTSLARVQPRPVPAGRHCTTGGTAVDTGRDVNEDGTLTGEEILGTLYVCQAASTYDGHYEVRGAADLVALAAISRVRGGLSIYNTELTEVVLPGLMSVEGPLSIYGNATLQRVELRGLRFVGESLGVSYNERLETLVVGVPGLVPEHTVWVAYDVGILSNPRLTTLEGLGAVSPHRHLAVVDNDLLALPGDLPLVQELVGGVTVRENAALQTLPLSNLSVVGGSVDVSENAALTSLEGLQRLRSIGGDFSFLNNDVLPGLFGLYSLGSIGGTLTVIGNDALQYAGIPGLNRVGGLNFSDNAALETVEAMYGLRLVENGVSFSNNPKLVSVKDFPQLRSLASLSLSDNALLADASAFELVPRLGSLTVARNGALTSLSFLRGLREVESFTVQQNPELARFDLDALALVSTLFTVTDNPKLPQCRATALASAVYTGAPEDRLIERNDEAASCAP
ncbi:MAG TPA: hypothetical protein VE153_24160 [Myxococcus sp.]|nr:hypothetical protein [Myxococcus sp.]